MYSSVPCINVDNLSWKYVRLSGFAKTLHIRTKTEIHFIAQDYSYTQKLFMHSVSSVQCELIYFSGANPIVSQLREWQL